MFASAFMSIFPLQPRNSPFHTHSQAAPWHTHTIAICLACGTPACILSLYLHFLHLFPDNYRLHSCFSLSINSSLYSPYTGTTRTTSRIKDTTNHIKEQIEDDIYLSSPTPDRIERPHNLARLQALPWNKLPPWTRDRSSFGAFSLYFHEQI